MKKPIFINGIKFPAKLSKWINEKGNLEIEGVEFPLTVMCEEWEEGPMGDNWQNLITQDINGNECIIEHEVSANKFELVKEVPQWRVKKMDDQELKSRAWRFAFEGDEENPAFENVMKELQLRLTEEDFHEFNQSLLFPY